MNSEIKPTIVLDHEHWLVINKPAGLAVHQDVHHHTFTVADWVLANYPALKTVGEPLVLDDGSKVEKPGIVHRLDKDTSGVMLIAKDQSTFLWLKEQFQNHQVKKTYLAVVFGEIRKDSGTINVPIGRSKKDPRIRVASFKAYGELRDAITDFTVLKRWPGYTLVEAYPRSGRTHQIRVHLKSIGHPIVGDRLYAEGRVPAVPVARQLLHASKIEFTLETGEAFSATAPRPADLTAFLEKIEPVC